MAACGGASLTEEAIRDRVNLRHQNLADVRSLSLPGSYHTKIIYLGESLQNFTCLKSLDLSRNALTTLEGLQHLIYLEKLNLYYNNISSFSEVFRLYTLTALKDVDLRLNPVVKNESDYRLFVIHMLPNLRLLDDRPVRDTERKASLLLFTTDHAYKFKNPSLALKDPETGRSVHPRADYINAMSKKCLVMDEDDESVLNLVAKCNWDLHKPPEISGSSKSHAAVEFHEPNNIYKAEENVERQWKSEGPHPQFVTLKKKCKNAAIENINRPKVKEIDKEYRILASSPVVHSGVGQGHEERKSGKVTFLGAMSHEHVKSDVNLKFRDETGANEEMATYAIFTPDPEVNDLLVNSWRTTGHDQQEPEPEDQRLNNKGVGVRSKQWNAILQAKIQRSDIVICKTEPMEHLLDLVDIHWNGHKSLHHNKKFLSQAEIILSSQAGKYSAMINSMKSDLENTKKEMVVLKKQMNNLLKENATLKVQHPKVEQNSQKADAAVATQIQLPKENQRLTDDNANSKENNQQFQKMQELTAMLQESHRTLVSTNERLLKELEEAHSRHKAEVEQLQWNYDQLKKTTGALPPETNKTDKTEKPEKTDRTEKIDKKDKNDKNDKKDKKDKK